VRDTSTLAVLRASGLLPGDVIVRLNGDALVSAEAGARALRSLETAQRVVLTVRRGAQDITLEAPLQ
jgi:type II secretory pathway component PulC